MFLGLSSVDNNATESLTCVTFDVVTSHDVDREYSFIFSNCFRCTAGALVVDGQDRVVLAELDARANHTIHLRRKKHD